MAGCGSTRKALTYFSFGTASNRRRRSIECGYRTHECRATHIPIRTVGRRLAEGDRTIGLAKMLVDALILAGEEEHAGQAAERLRRLGVIAGLARVANT